MFEKYEQMTGRLKEESKRQQVVGNIDSTVKEITQRLLNNYEAQEQKEILMQVKANLTKHYEELRQNHLRDAEKVAKDIEILQS